MPVMTLNYAFIYIYLLLQLQGQLTEAEEWKAVSHHAQILHIPTKLGNSCQPTEKINSDVLLPARVVCQKSDYCTGSA